MSLLRRLAGGFSRIAPFVLPGAGGVIGGAIAGAIAREDDAPRLPVPRGPNLPDIGRPGPGIIFPPLRQILDVTPGRGVGQAARRPKRRRRINPSNDKALRRALRRIEMYDRQRKRVDKALRKACPPTRRRRAPARRRGGGQGITVIDTD